MTDLHLLFPIFEPIFRDKFIGTAQEFYALNGTTFAQAGGTTLLDRILDIVDLGITAFAGLLNELGRYAVRSLTGGLDAAGQKKRAGVLEEIQNQIAGVLIVSDFYGRHQVARRARAAARVEEPPPGAGAPIGPPPDEPEVGEEYVDTPHEIRITVNAGLEDELPAIPNRDAIADIVSREPRLMQPVAEGGPKWLQVAKAYAEDHAFALAKSADLAVTERVQKHIARVLEEGGTVDQAAARIAEIGDFNRAYSETVFRTNAATAYSAGVMRQVRDPETSYHFPAMIYEAVHDSSTRPNHLAADGLTAATHDPIWNVWTPPAGYNCRCSVRLVSRGELETKGLLTKDGRVKPYYPPGLRSNSPDEGFGTGSVLGRFGGVPV